MKDKIILAVKGALFGVANIIPGVSGGTLALTMGVYEDLINAISHFSKDIKKSLKFLLVFGLGAVLSILLMSKVISLCLYKFPFPTTLFFIGLIMGGVPLLTRKVRKSKVKPFNLLLFFITFGIVIGMAFMQEGNNAVSLANVTPWMMILLFLVGMIAAATMVIPGVSGSFVLMLLGFYKPIVNVVSQLTDFSKVGHNLMVLIPFGIGVLLGIILIAKLIEFLFNKYELSTYYAILGFLIASIVTLCATLFQVSFSNIEVFVGIVLFAVSTIIGYKLGDA